MFSVKLIKTYEKAQMCIWEINFRSNKAKLFNDLKHGYRYNESYKYHRKKAVTRANG